ncbi:MAG TPA: hypothetical protein VJ692_05525 [Nitrospiraceae bacterium]|nr:hypothetical protein [Nitrospiraceae bacterium]
MTVYDFRTLSVITLLVGLIVLGAAASAHSQVGGGGGAMSGQMVRGDVLDIEDDIYVVKEITGHEARLKATKDTRMEDRIKVGDKIEAQVASDGHVTSMKVHIPDAASGTSITPGPLP